MTRTVKLRILMEGREYGYSLRKDVTVVGRDPHADVAIPSNSISRFHFQCTKSGEQVILKDLGSKNGTFVNGARVQEAALKSGDRIRAGRAEIHFLAADAATPPGALKAHDAGSAAHDGEKAPGQDSPTPVDLESPLPVSGSGAQGSSVSGPAAPGARARRISLAAAYGLGGAAVLICALGFWIQTRRAKEPAGPGTVASRAAEPAAGELPALARELARARDLTARDAREARALWSEIEKKLQALDAERPVDKTASRLLRLAGYWKGVKPDYSNFPWASRGEIDDLLGEIRDAQRTPPEVSALAKEWASWFRAETTARLAAEEAARAAAADDEEGWRRAMEKAQGVPADSVSAGAARAAAEAARGKLHAMYRQRAQTDFENEAWEPALANLDKAAACGPSGPLESLRAQVAAERLAQSALAEARDAFERGNGERARQLAAAVTAPSRYAVKARALEAELEKRDALRGVRDLFQKGDAEGALKLLAASKYPSEDLASLIRRVNREWSDALWAEKKLDFEGSLAHADQVLVLLAAPEHSQNNFRAQADALKARWGDSAQRARRYYQKGLDEKSSNPKAALSWWRKAQADDPDRKMAAQEIRQFEDVAAHKYTQGMQAAAEGKPASARALFEESLKYVDDRSTYFSLVQKELDKLDASGK